MSFKNRISFGVVKVVMSAGFLFFIVLVVKFNVVQRSIFKFELCFNELGADVVPKCQGIRDGLYKDFPDCSGTTIFRSRMLPCDQQSSWALH